MKRFLFVSALAFWGTIFLANAGFCATLAPAPVDSTSTSIAASTSCTTQTYSRTASGLNEETRMTNISSSCLPPPPPATNCRANFDKFNPQICCADGSCMQVWYRLDINPQPPPGLTSAYHYDDCRSKTCYANFQSACGYTDRKCYIDYTADRDCSKNTCRWWVNGPDSCCDGTAPCPPG